MINDKDKKFLLELSRRAIKHFLGTSEILEIDPSAIISKELNQKTGSFVTLHKKNGDLRGCIGNLEGTGELWKDIINNAISAAFYDPRFTALSQEDFKDINLEISILSQPQKIEYKNTKELLDKITPQEDGIIFKKGFKSSTFLPQVWEHLSGKEEFLEHLCLKAGCAPLAWKEGGAEFLKYNAEHFSE